MHPDLEHHNEIGWHALFTESGTLLFAGPYSKEAIYRAYGAVLYDEEPLEYGDVDAAIEWARNNYAVLPCAARIAVINDFDIEREPTTHWLDEAALPE